jgi:hypothetical protein
MAWAMPAAAAQQEAQSSLATLAACPTGSPEPHTWTPAREASTRAAIYRNTHPAAALHRHRQFVIKKIHLMTGPRRCIRTRSNPKILDAEFKSLGMLQPQTRQARRALTFARSTQNLQSPFAIAHKLHSNSLNIIYLN